MTDAAAHLEIVPVDPRDESALRAWHAAYFEAETRDRPFATPWMFEEVRAAAQAPAVANERIVLSGLVDGRTVCAAQLILPLKDNLGHADFNLHTQPDQQRRGYGTAMLQHVESVAAERDRHHVTTRVDHQYDLGPTGAGAPGVEFLQRHGYTHALGEVQSACPVPVPGDLLASLATEAASHHEGYSVRTFVDRCPDEIIDSFGRLMGMLVTEAPTGELEVETEVFDEERIRAQEDTMAQSGRTSYFAVALDAGGDVVAYTQVVVPQHDPGRAYQWGTLVDPAHRGHRLGLAVKTANLALLQEHEPDVTSVITYNAEVNDHMLGVNRRFGFTPTARLVELQKTI